jgi:20S proteasome alpha/beta subunit
MLGIDNKAQVCFRMPPQLRPPVPSPVKHVRYPWGRPKEKQMTIVAGFVVRNGILLCSDSQYSGYEKVYNDKLFSRHLDHATVAFALAGDGDYARSAIEDCWESIDVIPPNQQTIPNLRRSIRRTLTNSLKNCPGPEEAKPVFLIAIAHDTEGSGLFRSKGSAMAPVERFDALGSGAGVAEFIMKSFARMQLDFMTLEGATLMGLRLVAAAKRNDPNVGGGTQFLSLRGTGTFQFTATESEGCDRHINHYDYLAENLLTIIGNANISEEEFDSHLAFFMEQAKSVRKNLIGHGSRYRMLVESLRQTGPGGRELELHEKIEQVLGPPDPAT